MCLHSVCVVRLDKIADRNPLSEQRFALIRRAQCVNLVFFELPTDTSLN